MIAPDIAPGVVIPRHAIIRGRAVIKTQADILVRGPGPSGLYTTAHRDADIGVRVNRKCLSGTIEQFEAFIEVYRLISDESRAVARQYAADIREHFALPD